MKESEFQTRFIKWLKKNATQSAAYELKITKGKSLSFNSVLDHQIDALLSVKRRSIAYKIADDSRNYKPFDCFFMKELPAWIVIMFYEKGKSEFIMIDIDDFVEEEAYSTRKSITEDRAKEIGIVCSLKS